MKKTLLIALSVILIKYVSGQFSLDHYHPVDIIAAEGIDTCSIYVLQSDSSHVIEQSYIYNPKGLEIENRRDYQKFSFIYRYNEEGLQIAQYFVPFGEIFFERDTLIYDKKGRLRQRITYSTDGSESKRNEYDYKKRLIKEERYILKGKLQTKSLYKYDKKKRVHRIEKYLKGNHWQDWIHEYDDNDNLISFTTVAANGVITLLHEFEYNEKGLRIKHLIYSEGDKLSTQFSTTYDSIGLILFMEAITSIKNNDLATGDYEKTIYKYTYR